MKNFKIIRALAILIVVLSLASSLAGLLSTGGNGQYAFRAINGSTVQIQGTGLYRNDSVSVAAQGIASDLITLAVGIPLLASSLYFAGKGSFRSRLLLTGTLGFFLYTYMSYTFLWMYNPFFIVYVLLMSCSLFAFILSMMSFDIETIKSMFKNDMPVRLLGGFQIFIAIAVGLLWLGKIAPSIVAGTVPAGLDHYTTLVIQAMDLGIVVPAALMSGILLVRKRPYGYLLSSVIIIKGITMLTAISAMIINQALCGVAMSPMETALFPALNIFAFICLAILMKSVVGTHKPA